MSEALETGPLELLGLLPGASNYTLLAKLLDDGVPQARTAPGQTASLTAGGRLVVYKPRRGEMPLWDFPPGTLCQREVAACLVAEAGGWDFIPPTVLRDGPLGTGAVQVYIEHDPSITAFELLRSHRRDLKRIALFDLIANNADRKAGHVLVDSSGKVWGLDHGLCFHEEPKLRTVLWDFIGEPVPSDDLDLVLAVCHFLDRDPGELAKLLSSGEYEALRARVRRVLDEKTFPPPQTSRPYPWPPV